MADPTSEHRITNDDRAIPWSAADDLFVAWVTDLVKALHRLIEHRCPHPAGRATCNQWLAQLADAAKRRQVDLVRVYERRIRLKVALERTWHATKIRNRRAQGRRWRQMP